MIVEPVGTELATQLDVLRKNREDGATYLARHGLEVLIQAATEAPEGPEGWGLIETVASELVRIRPEMAVIANKVNAVMYEARTSQATSDVRRVAHRLLCEAKAEAANVAQHAVPFLAGRRILTLSYSGTARDALYLSQPQRVWVLYSDPGGEGHRMAQELNESQVPTTLVPDAALGHIMSQERIEVAVVGADTILPNGDVINKTGTHALALACAALEIPLFVLTAIDKVAPFDEFDRSLAPLAPFGELEEGIQWPMFERTPAARFSGYITQFGNLLLPELDEWVGQLRKRAAWNEG